MLHWLVWGKGCISATIWSWAATKECSCYLKTNTHTQKKKTRREFRGRFYGFMKLNVNLRNERRAGSEDGWQLSAHPFPPPDGFAATGM